MNIIEVHGATKQFKDQPVLKETMISFEAGKIHCIVGMNGSGKTVFLKLLCGLLCPSTGTITVCEKELGKDNNFAPNTGILIETPSFLPYKSGKNSLWDLTSTQHKIEKKIIETMHTVGLDPIAKNGLENTPLGCASIWASHKLLWKNRCCFCGMSL